MFKFCSVLALTAVLAATALAGEGSNRAPQQEHSPDDDGSLGNVFDGIDDLFGGDQPETAISTLQAGADYSDILKDRSRSLRLFHGYGTGIVVYEPLENYVNDVLDRLVSALPVVGFEPHAYVMGSDRFSASAAPCGAIALDWGLLRGLDSEDELAFVMAHEIAHVLFRHHSADWFVDAQHYAVTSGGITQEILGEVEQVAGRSTGKAADLDRMVRIGRLTFKVSEGVLLPLWSRNQEDEADRFAVDLLVLSRYNHASALTFFAKLQAWEEQLEDSEEQDMDSLIRRHFDKPLPDVNNPASLADSAVAFFDDLLTQGGAFAEDHYPAGERKEAVQEYVLKNYKKVRMSPRTPLPWKGEAGNPEIVDLHRKYEAASRAFQSLDQVEFAEALSLAKEAVRGQTVYHGYPRYAFYSVRLAEGNKSKAVANLEYALKDPRPGVLIWKERIRLAEELQGVPAAVELLDEARRRLDDPPYFIPERIRLYPRVGRKDEVSDLLIECQYNWRQLADKCEAAAEDSRL